ncbi:MAG: hypothetical protein V7K92_18810 [Nostoc sp.]
MVKQRSFLPTALLKTGDALAFGHPTAGARGATAVFSLQPFGHPTAGVSLSLWEKGRRQGRKRCGSESDACGLANAVLLSVRD